MLTITKLSMILLVGQDANGAAAAVPDSVQIHSIWDFVVKGGPVMIPIGICSLVAMAIVLERMVSLRRERVIPSNFLPGLKDVLAASGDWQGVESSGGADVAKALEYCKANPSSVARVFAAGIKRLGESEETLERHIQEAGEREALKLRKFLRGLSVIGSIAPLLGLLGTIFGMITAFQTVAVSGEALGKTELLAKGIYEAMITTAAGLIVAIPVVIFYHWLSAKIDALVMRIDRMTMEFIEEYGRPRSTAAAERHAAHANGQTAPSSMIDQPRSAPAGA